MTIQLFELACADQRILFSPYCWRVRMALRHKGLAFESLPWHFTEKDRIEAYGSARVPVLLDGDRAIKESFDIALYLDEAYPEAPALMADAAARARAKFIESWCATAVLPRIRPLAVPDILGIIAEKDKAYFRESREALFGCRLEEISKDFAAERIALHEALSPVADALAFAPFLAGEAPDYADYVLFGSLMWPYTACKREIIDFSSPVGTWFARMLDLNEGFARKAARAADT